MPRTLQKLPFSRQFLNAVQGFYCGDEPWNRELAQWICADPDGALASVESGRCQVWLYVTEREGLIGYGSLGPTNWKWPTPESPRVPISIIPYVALERKFWGKPEGPAEDRYSAQLLDDLIYEAQ